MNRKRIYLILVILCVVLLSQGAPVVFAQNYLMGWWGGCTGSGGMASSAHYAVNMTAGQTPVGNMSSSRYAGGLGYWSGISPIFRNFLPWANR